MAVLQKGKDLLVRHYWLALSVLAIMALVVIVTTSSFGWRAVTWVVVLLGVFYGPWWKGVSVLTRRLPGRAYAILFRLTVALLPLVGAVYMFATDTYIFGAEHIKSEALGVFALAIVGLQAAGGNPIPPQSEKKVRNDNNAY